MKSAFKAWSLALATTLFAAAGALPVDALAAPAANDATALFLKGRKAVEQGDYKAALEDLRTSYAALPSPNTLLLIAHAERGLGHRVAAMKLYEQVEREASAKVQAGEKRYEVTVVEARKEMESVSRDLGSLSLRITRAPAGLEVKVNGELVELAASDGTATAPKLWVEPGELTIVASAGDKSFEFTGAANRGAQKELSFDFVAKTTREAPKPAPVAPAPPPASEGKRSIPVATWIAGGVGVAGLATFAVFGSMAKGKYDDLQSCSPRCDDSKRDLADSGKTQQTIANIGLVVGGIGLATAAGFLVLKKPEKQSPATVGLAAGPGSIQLYGSY